MTTPIPPFFLAHHLLRPTDMDTQHSGWGYNIDLGRLHTVCKLLFADVSIALTRSSESRESELSGTRGKTKA